MKANFCVLKPLALGCLCLLLSGAHGAAQQVLAPPPVDYSGLSPLLRTTGTNAPGEMPLPAPVPQQDQAPITAGPIQVRPHVLYRFLYGDGVPSSPGQNVKTAINELYPGVFFGLGDHWRLDYTPALRFYSSDQFRNTFDNAVSLYGGTTFEDWSLGFSQTYASSSQPLIATGTQTDQEQLGTGLSGTYQLNQALSLELGANQSIRLFGQNPAGENLTDSYTWSTLDWLSYQISPKFGVALGAGFTYDHLDVGSDMSSEQLQGRVTWRPGEKLFFSASGGFEVRQFLGVDAPTALNPIFGVSALYHLFEPTTLSLGANRTVSPAYFQNQINETFSITAGLNQRLLGKLFLDLTGGYSQNAYRSSAGLSNVNRNDDTAFFNARLTLQVIRRGTIAVFYQYLENNSNETLFTLSSTQVGFELGYRF